MRKFIIGYLAFLLFAIFFSEDIMSQNSIKNDPQIETATFGAGCFWCVEAIFKEAKGVKEVMPGYAGGITENPTYREVCTGKTGHAEVTKIEYDPLIISYHDLLEIFWGIHDPTTLNRQGADIGTQYRSVIFYHNDDQKRTAEFYKEELNRINTFGQPVITEISPLKTFYPAENYHRNYYENNKNQPYCKIVIAPKLDKFRQAFSNKNKEE